MVAENVFLGFAQPALVSAVEYLWERFWTGTHLDLGACTIVIPGARAGRRLLELMVLKAHQHDSFVIPPTILTTGAVPELFYTPRHQLASELERLLAWEQALRQCSREELTALLPFPEQLSSTDMLTLARTVDGLYAELSAACVTFSKVATEVHKHSEHLNDERWIVLDTVSKVYRTCLEQWGRADLHHERMYALESQAGNFEKPIFLLAAVDLHPVSRRFLESSRGPVTALIHADVSFEQYFDSFGALKSNSDLGFPYTIPSESLRIAADPSDQASLVAIELGTRAQGRSLDEITIGCADENLKPFIQDVLSEYSIPVHDAAGRPLTELAPLQFLEKLNRYLESERFEDFSALLRLGCVRSWIEHSIYTTPHESDESGGTKNVLSVLDSYQARHVQSFLSLGKAGQAVSLFGNSEDARRASQIAAALKALLGDLIGPPRPLSACCQELAACLVRLFFHSCDSASAEALQQVREILDELREHPSSFDSKPLSISALLRLVRLGLSALTIEADSDGDAIDLVGWLELALDDAPVICIVGVNEGNIPEARNEHPFLPNSLRTILGLPDNQSRRVRDSFLMRAIYSSASVVCCIAGRFDSTGNPLHPSQLTLGDSPEEQAKRIMQFYKTAPHKRALPDSPSEKIWTLEAPDVADLPRPETIPVTGFGAYLTCPYQFYLAYCLKLEEVERNLLELDPRGFGNIMHAVLARFGGDSIIRSNNQGHITEFLEDTLSDLFNRQFGPQCAPAIPVQFVQMRERLTNFARWQAQWVEQGWETVAVESAIDFKKARLNLSPDVSLGLTGRIDRIDFHAPTGRLIVFDYKTGDSSPSPEEKHRRGGKWVDLQLPLYRYALQSMREEVSPEVGYIVLSPRSSDACGQIASWTEEQFTEALTCATQVAAKILNKEFWPPSSKIRRSSDIQSGLDRLLSAYV